MTRKIVIPGGSGAVGQLLARHFHRLGDQVVVLSRSPRQTPWRTIAWDGQRLGKWAEEIDGADVVINLAGRTVDCRYTKANRKEIMDSRVLSTTVVGEAIRAARRPPALWINASTATIYRHSLDRDMDERTGEFGLEEAESLAKGGGMATWGFSIDVARAWEKAFFGPTDPCVDARLQVGSTSFALAGWNSTGKGTRKVAIRSAMVAIGGVSWLGKLTRLAKLGLGGAAGAGNQYMSWIHETDFIRAIEFLIQHEEVDGCVNLGSPNPIPNGEFMRAIREACGVPFGPPLPEWLLRFGSRWIGTEAELILKSRRVVPARLLDAGFEFRFPTWPEAARDLLAGQECWGASFARSTRANPR